MIIFYGGTEMNNKGKLIVGLVSLACILSIVMVFKSNSNDLRNRAEVYLEKTYDNTEFNYIETIYRIDGDIYEIKFSTNTTDLEYSVFIVKNGIYDNYLRTNIENQKKEIVYETLKQDMEKKTVDIYLDFPFEDDMKLKNYMGKLDELSYTLGLYHDKNYDRTAIVEKYSEIAHRIFTKYSNVNSIIVKNYEREDVELYLFIENQELNSDFSVETIKEYLENKKMIYGK